MATITQTVSLGKPAVSRNDRTDLRSQIAKYWVGKEHSRVSLQYLQYTYRPDPEYKQYARETNGKIVVPSHSFERDDIFCVQHCEPGINTFVTLVGDSYSISIQPWSEVSLSAQEEQIIRDQIDAIMKDPNNAEYIERHRKWFSEKPWKQLDGLTPAEAVAKLESMGW